MAIIVEVGIVGEVSRRWQWYIKQEAIEIQGTLLSASSVVQAICPQRVLKWGGQVFLFRYIVNKREYPSYRNYNYE